MQPPQRNCHRSRSRKLRMRERRKEKEGEGRRGGEDKDESGRKSRVCNSALGQFQGRTSPTSVGGGGLEREGR